MENQSAESAKGSSARVSGEATILLVEDHPETAYVMQRLLGMNGLHVHIARSVQEALAQAELRRFDLILCDIGLPDGDGSAILNEIRKHYPIEGIVLSAHAFPADIERSRAAGYIEHLIKPITPERVLAAIRRHVRFDNA